VVKTIIGILAVRAARIVENLDLFETSSAYYSDDLS